MDCIHARIGRVAVHPRVCGEHMAARMGSKLVPGSSPRVRGTYRMLPDCNASIRFIPACAGNIVIKEDIVKEQAVHPRVCGEHFAPCFTVGCKGGSSPRVRGTCSTCRPTKSARRFIPACAGNIAMLPALKTAITVHPRVCGEHQVYRQSYRHSSGSSPRVRGTFRHRGMDDWVIRFIPACAGNIHTLLPNAPFIAVHPRVCGEHMTAAAVE